MKPQVSTILLPNNVLRFMEESSGSMKTKWTEEEIAIISKSKELKMSARKTLAALRLVGSNRTICAVLNKLGNL